MLKPKVLVLSGDGINCEFETAHAFEKAGGECHKVHVNELDKLSFKKLDDFQVFALPGGFSFGDELGSGRVLSLKIQYKMKDFYSLLMDSHKPILAICNGFQVLSCLGVFTNGDKKQLSLTENKQHQFLNHWSELEVSARTHCLWLKNLSELHMPIRHKEGRLVLSSEISEKNKISIEKSLICLRYRRDVNGSFDRAAGLTNEKGNILALMPHPEAAIDSRLFPQADHSGYLDNLKLFQNAIEFVREM